jgi:ribosomal protein S8
MVKNKVLHMRIDSKLKERIGQYAKEKGYSNPTKFVIDIINDKLDPVKRNNQIKIELHEAFHDPDVITAWKTMTREQLIDILNDSEIRHLLGLK